MKQKPTYRIPVAVCAIVLFVGAITLAILMETRQIPPPRKYKVDTSGEIIGIDNGPKTPVLTKEEMEDIKVEEVKKVEKAVPTTKHEEETAKPEEPVIVPTVPEGEQTTAPAISVPTPEVKKTVPDIEKSVPKIKKPTTEKLE